MFFRSNHNKGKHWCYLRGGKESQCTSQYGRLSIKCLKDYDDGSGPRGTECISEVPFWSVLVNRWGGSDCAVCIAPQLHSSDSRCVCLYSFMYTFVRIQCSLVRQTNLINWTFGEVMAPEGILLNLTCC